MKRRHAPRAYAAVISTTPWARQTFQDGAGGPDLAPDSSESAPAIERLQCATTRSLHGARNEDHAKIGCRAAGERRNCEEGNGAEEKLATAEAQGKPTARRRHYGVGYKIAGQNPGGFIGSSGKAAGDVWQGD